MGDVKAYLFRLQRLRHNVQDTASPATDDKKNKSKDVVSQRLRPAFFVGPTIESAVSQRPSATDLQVEARPQMIRRRKY